MNQIATTPVLLYCPHCGGIHIGVCPRIKRVEYNPDGTLKAIEYHDPSPPTLTPILPIQPPPPPLTGPTWSVCNGNADCVCRHSWEAHTGHTYMTGTPEPTHCSQGCGCLAYRRPT